MDEQVAGRFSAVPANYNTDLIHEPKKERKLERENKIKSPPPVAKKVTALIRPETFVKKKGGVCPSFLRPAHVSLELQE